jgi:thiamine kinase-like enzyme
MVRHLHPSAKLSPKQQSGYRDQMVDILKQLRQFTAPFPQKANGDKLYDSILCLCGSRHSPACFKIGSTKEEWLDPFLADLRGGLTRIYKTKDPKVIEEKLQEIKNDFPRGGPYVLSHGDLNLTNIIVKDDMIEAIIDWEVSGYFPWCGETYVNIMFSDADTFELFEDVWDRVYPDLGRDTLALVKRLSYCVRSV